RFCISGSLVCDGRSHCRDGSDEVDCPTVASPVTLKNILKCRMGSKPCEDGTESDFLCKDRRSCVSKNQVCDGRSHCHDGSDEVNCASEGPRAPQKAELKCRFGSKLCRDGTECVLLSHVCDGEDDCQDGSDEEECGKGFCFLKLLKYVVCVSKNQVCDGRSHCHDGSDEVNCASEGPRAPQKAELKCRFGSKLCRDGTECVLLSHVCDGEDDCQDGSDEEECGEGFCFS
uniref:Uncharacterized protein n=1 Tax=Oryzias melastigma TaxID=30732 RepID=A0A3B3CPX0_ORYME